VIYLAIGLCVLTGLLALCAVGVHYERLLQQAEEECRERNNQ